MTSAEPGPVPGTGPGGTLLVRGGHVITMDPGTGDLPGGDVLVRGGAIAAVGPAWPRRPMRASWMRPG